MAIISAEELNNQIVDLYTGTDYFYGLLLNAPGTTFTGASTLEDVLAFEVDSSIGGYERQEFYYVSGDIIHIAVVYRLTPKELLLPIMQLPDRLPIGTLPM